MVLSVSVVIAARNESVIVARECDSLISRQPILLLSMNLDFRTVDDRNQRRNNEFFRDKIADPRFNYQVSNVQNSYCSAECG